MTKKLFLGLVAAVSLSSTPALANNTDSPSSSESTDVKISSPADLEKVRGATHKGDLSIMNYTGEDLRGLENLSAIDGDLIIFSNNKLKSLEGLDNLELVRGSVNIFSNRELQSLADLRKLRETKLGINISDNPSLTKLMPKPLTIGEPLWKKKGSITIKNNRKLGQKAAESYADSCTFRGGKAWVRDIANNGP